MESDFDQANWNIYIYKCYTIQFSTKPLLWQEKLFANLKTEPKTIGFFRELN